MSDRSTDDQSSSRKMAPEPYSFLPETETWPLDPPEQPTEGWWKDPLSSFDIYQRYFDGTKWTPYVSGRTARRWTEIFPDDLNTEVDPTALGIPLPPATPALSAEPPTKGWWKDPLQPKLKQARYFDGEQWTDLIAPTKSAGPRLVTRRSDPKANQSGAEGPGPETPALERRWPWSRRGDA